MRRDDKRLRRAYAPFGIETVYAGLSTGRKITLAGDRSMIKTFAQCSGDHKLTVSTEFPMDQGWVLGYVEYQMDETRGPGTTKGATDPDGTGGRKRICIEPWADEAAF